MKPAISSGKEKSPRAARAPTVLYAAAALLSLLGLADAIYLTIQHVTANDRLILRPTVITRYRDGVRTDTPIEPADIRRFARELFNVDLGETPLLFEEDR